MLVGISPAVRSLDTCSSSRHNGWGLLGPQPFILVACMYCDLFRLTCRYRHASYEVFKRMGVPGPPPLPLLGNYLTLLRKVQHTHLYLVVQNDCIGWARIRTEGVACLCIAQECNQCQRSNHFGALSSWIVSWIVTLLVQLLRRATHMYTCEKSPSSDVQL